MWSIVPLPLRNPACSIGSSGIRKASSLFCRTLRSILLACEIKAIVRKFPHSFLSPFLQIGTYMDFFQSFGHVFIFHMLLHRFVMTLIASSPPAFRNSIGIPSQPGAFLLDMCCIASFTSISNTSGSS